MKHGVKHAHDARHAEARAQHTRSSSLLTSTPCATKAFTTLKCPFCDADIRGVNCNKTSSAFTKVAQRNLETCMLHSALYSSSHRRNMVYACLSQHVIACSSATGTYLNCYQPAYLNGRSPLKVAVSTQGLQLIHHLHMAFISSTQQRIQALQRQIGAVGKALVIP